METKYNQSEYRENEITPQDMRCGVGMCPGIYKGIKIVSPQEECGLGACPTIYSVQRHDIDKGKISVYLIIGKLINKEQLKKIGLTGLEKKISRDEVLIEVPKKLIDDIKNQK